MQAGLMGYFKLSTRGLMPLSNKNKGIALFQVLLITAVISLLAIQFTQTAQNQIAIASTIVDRVQAQVDLRTLESELLFTLLTERNVQQVNSSNPYVANWNFYGKPFSLTQQAANRTSSAEDFDDRLTTAVFSIQDQNSLISLYNDSNPEKLTALFTKLKHTNSTLEAQDFDINIAVASLLDWQDSDDFELINGAESKFYDKKGMPTNIPLQTYEELALIRGFNRPIIDELQPFLTIRAQGYFNPMQAPVEILELYMESDRAAEILRLRDEGLLDVRQFEILSGLEVDETLNFVTSGSLNVQLTVQVNEVVLTKSMALFLQPYSYHPFYIYKIKI
jgi:general secretion pathway protein K